METHTPGDAKWGAERYQDTTPKCASFVHGLFGAKDHWELADSGQALVTGHKFSFALEICITIKEISICREVSLSCTKVRLKSA